MVPPASHRVSRVRRYSGRATARVSRFRLRGHNPVSPAFPCRSATEPLCHRAGGNRGPPASLAPQPRRRNARALHAAAGLAVGPRSLAATRGISFDFSSSGYLDVSVPPVVPARPMSSGGRARALPRAGFPIRRPAGRRPFAPLRRLSQLVASFVGFPCQGIRRVPLVSSRTFS